MRIHIIGPGVVGLATGEGLRRFGHTVCYTDQGERHNIPADLHFVCVPERAVLPVVKELGDARGSIIIRSTVEPGTTDTLRLMLERDIWHNPEFLQEATAEQDFLFRNYTIIGGPMPIPRDLLNLYRQMAVKTVLCSALESEYAKLVLNAYFATQIAFWNEIGAHLEKQDVNSHRLARLVTLDKRVSRHGAAMHGKPFGGKCLPKDLAQLIQTMGADARILRLVAEHGESPPVAANRTVASPEGLSVKAPA